MTVYLETTVACWYKTQKRAPSSLQSSRECVTTKITDSYVALLAQISEIPKIQVLRVRVFYWVPLADVNEIARSLSHESCWNRGPVYPCPHDGDGNNKSAKTQPTTHVLELTECHDSEISYKFIRCKNHIPITFGILEILDISRQSL